MSTEIAPRLDGANALDFARDLINRNLVDRIWGQLHSLPEHEHERVWNAIEDGKMIYNLDRDAGCIHVVIDGSPFLTAKVTDLARLW